MNKKIYHLVFCLFLLNACAPTRIIKPLAKGEQAIGANFGGPLIKMGSTPITIPYTSAFYAKGISDKTTAFGSLHLTALSFGVFQTDIGVCHELYYSDKLKLGISANPAINFAIDRWEWKAKVWPQLDVNLHKEFGTNKLLYAGLCNWFELSKLRAHDEDQPKHWFMSPQIGFQYTPKKWSYGIETKWVAPGVPNQPNVADYIGPNHMGAIGIYLQFTRRF
ncbi:MAG: hypothetical protein CFE21_01550 [Bacteroidetes bacterium B1(2017)]|nr:MAG: hypothetical protein CFE21_01550 [Bacteroidetes bacterium B1(2017)]